MSDSRIHNGVPPMIENRIAPTHGADARPANILGPDEDGLPIARYSYQTGVGMVEHRNGTYVRYGEVELRLRSFKGPADAPSDAIGASK